MKIAIYSPYLDTFGGGERYILTIAEYLSYKHQVDLLFDAHLQAIGPEAMQEKLMSFLSLDLSKINIIQAPLGRGSNILERSLFLRQYDLFFYVTDGSIFYSTAKNNYIHFQVPFQNSSTSIWGKIKLSSWKEAIFNSTFTKEIVQKSWKINGRVIYPPIDVESFLPAPKTKVILSVGRFFDFLHSKKQEVLVETFIKMVKGGLKGWTLVLAGGTNQAGQEYIKKIKQKATGFPVEFYCDVSFKKLKKLYGEASIYWHGAGFGESDPKKMEHFGMTTVEAMAAGCVPVVINKGGLVETVEHDKSGYLWETEDQLIDYTTKLINNKLLMSKFSQNAHARSKLFSKDKFCQRIERLINENS